MSVENFLNYSAYIQLQNRQLEIWGQPCTIYVPKNITNLGYENVRAEEVEAMNSDKVLANSYSKLETRIWINFTPNKNVFYKFNYFPTDQEELCTAVMKSTSEVRENSYVRTALPSQTSIWGDMIFQVVNIKDSGIGKTLERIYFLRPTANADLHFVLDF